jgi:hypothetical protein
MSQTIYDQFIEISKRLQGEGHHPVRVIFSSHGHLKARAENGSQLGTLVDTDFKTYMGLPYTIRSDMAGEIGLDYKFEPRRDAVTIQLGFNAKTGHVMVDNKPFGEPVHIMQIIGSHLTRTQLCDIIQSYLDRLHHKPLSDFDRALAGLLRRHGRFE